MTDRRRNILILVFIAGLIAASAIIVATKPTKLGLDLKGGTSLVFQAKPTKQSQVTSESVQRTIDIMRDRVDKFGVAEPEIQRTGSDQIDVSLPGVKNADQARQQVGKTAQLYFYDWEPNVLGPGCKPDPTNQSVTGGPAAANGTGALTQYDAVRRASTCKPTNTGKETTNGAYYLVDTKAKTVLAGPQESRADLQGEIADSTSPKITEGPNTEVVKVPQGTVVVAAEGGTGKPTDKYYVLKDQPALSGLDIKNPEQNFDNGAGGSGGPTVTFDFTDKGKNAWQKTTRAIAQRGQENFFGGSANNAFQHFAIVLDNEIISAPYIDFQQNPDGIDASNGSEISGGFTIQTAQNLANLLKTGALPIKLELISSSQVSATLGKQALHQGLIAGVVGLLLVSLFLLIIYRVLGIVAVGALGVYSLFMFAMVKLIPITLTLPGIAGLILTIGVAADANIVIFERVKEEIRHGQIRARSDQSGLPQGPDGDHRRERRDVHGRVHPFHPRDRGREGIRLRPRRRHARLVPDGRPAHAGRPRRARAVQDHHPPGGPRRAVHARTLPLGFHGQVEVLLRGVRRDPADRRAVDRCEGSQPRDRLHLGLARRRGAQQVRE